MNSPLFEPRRVAAQAAARWLRESVTLLGRAPLAFGLVLAAATMVDRLVLGALAAIATPAQIALAGAALYWPLVAASIVVARAADLSGPAAHGSRLWRSAIGAALIAGGICALGVWLPTGVASRAPEVRSLWPLAILWGSLATYLLGSSFLPLMAFSPASRGVGLRLSWRAHRRNPQPSLNLAMLVAITSTLGASLLPAELASLVAAFHGTLFYVAYREMFEGRARSFAVLRKASLALVPAPAVAARQRPRKR